MQITLDEVSVLFEEKLILDNINTKLTHKRIGVIGSNGSGKSTFLRLLNGLVHPSSGTVKVNGFDTKNHLKEIRKNVGFLFQNPEHQIIMPTVSEDLLLGLKALGLNKSEKKRRLEETVEKFNISKFIDQSSHSLSGGEKQLVALAAIMITKPKILVCDEPTTLLDLKNKELIINTLLNIECNIVIVSHDLEYFKSFDELILFHKGKLVDKGMPDSIINRYLEIIT